MKRIITIIAAAMVLTCCATTRQAAPASPAGVEINAGSFNIRNENRGDDKNGDGWAVRRDVLADMITFCGWDVFGLQEAKKNQIDDILARIPGYAFVGVGRDDGKEKGEYSPVLYNSRKFELLDSGTFWLSETPDVPGLGWDAMCVRVCSWAKLRDRRGGEAFWFFNTHLDHVGTTARREGVKLILAKTREIAGNSGRVIITGDFNVDQYSDATATMLSDGRFQDSHIIAQTRFMPNGTFNNFNPEAYTISHIDHIFVGTGSTVTRFGVLTYHYWDSATGDDEKLKAAPSEIKADTRRVRCISDHYPINSYVILP